MVDAQCDFCHITATWKIVSDQDIAEFVVYRREDPEQETRGKVAPPGGLTLERESSSGAPCQLLFEVRPRPADDITIVAVDVLSDGDKAEVFTHSQGYVGITHGVRVDEDLQVEGKLFLLQHEFDEPVKKCSLQLIPNSQSNTIWVHTIYVTIETRPMMPSITDLSMMMMGIRPTTDNPSIDLGKVKTLMSGVDSNIPEGAKQLLDTMETFQKNKMPFSGGTPSVSAVPSATGGGFDQMTALMSMFQGLNTAPSLRQQPSTDKPTTPHTSQLNLSSNPQTDDTCIKDGVQRYSHKTGCSNDQPKSDIHETRSDESTHSENAAGFSKLLMAHMEAKFLEHMNRVEERISQTVSQRLSAVESRILNRLDRILEIMPEHNERQRKSSSPERCRTSVTELENREQAHDSSQDLD